MMIHALQPRRRAHRGMTFIELMVGMVLTGVIITSTYRIFKSTSKSTIQNVESSKAELDVKRFVSMVSNDIERAGSDPTGRALYGYIKFDECGPASADPEYQAPVQIVYGINPAPANEDCSVQIGEFGLMSYLPFDENNDGEIGPEEGLSFDADDNGTVDPYEGLGVGVLASPLLRKETDDYIVYDLYDSDGDGLDDTIRRINVGNAFDDTDDVAEDVLRNVADIEVQYFGIVAGTDGEYGEIDNLTFFNNMREIQITVYSLYGYFDPGYTNPFFDSDHPYYNHRTNRTVFRVGVNVIKPEA
jgi:prepilin-type N-terminal cleavage/methylation domain-containing protein